MKLRTTLLAAGTGAAAIAAVLGAATPALAKSDTMLTGPRSAQAGHPFHLVVWVGDDAGARRASARLQILGAHGKFYWYGPWQRLRIDRANPDEESGTFVIRPGHRGKETFRAVVTGYLTTNTVTVPVR